MSRCLPLVFLLFTLPVLAQPDPPAFYVVTYSPGAAWQGSSVNDQPGVQAHIDYIEQMHKKGLVLMDGLLTDEPGEMVLLRTSSLADAQDFAEADPAVSSGVLVPRISGWRVRMSTMRQVARPQTPPTDPGLPFKVERIDPDAPINLKNPPDEGK